MKPAILSWVIIWLLAYLRFPLFKKIGLWILEAPSLKYFYSQHIFNLIPITLSFISWNSFGIRIYTTQVSKLYPYQCLQQTLYLAAYLPSSCQIINNVAVLSCFFLNLMHTQTVWAKFFCYFNIALLPSLIYIKKLTTCFHSLSHYILYVIWAGVFIQW